MKVITSHLTHLPVVISPRCIAFNSASFCKFSFLCFCRFHPSTNHFMNNITKLTSRIMKKFIHQLIKFCLCQIFGIFTDCLLWLLPSGSTDGFVPFASFSVYLDSSRISGSYALPVPSQAFAVSMQLLFFNLKKCFLSIFLKCFLLRHIVLFLLFQFFPFLCYGIGISAGRETLLRMDHPQTLSEFPFRKMLLP